MNKRDQAIEWVRKAANEGFPCYPLFMGDKNLDNLRQDPRFVSLMADLQKQWESNKAL